MTFREIDNPAVLWRMYRQRAKTHLGQHFLVHRDILESLVDAAGVRAGDRVLEIGPGCGTLTWTLLQRDVDVLAFEVDTEAVDFLQRIFQSEDRLEIEPEDVLDADLEEYLSLSTHEGTWRSVANLPYHAATEIFFQTAPLLDRFECLVWMFQREVAQRFVASVGDDDYGVLSILGRLYADVEIVKRLKPGAFEPAPQVHSAALRLAPIDDTRIADDGIRETFTSIVRTAFQARRKILPNALAPLAFEDAAIDEALERAELDRNLRPEDISPADYRALAGYLSSDSADEMESH